MKNDNICVNLFITMQYMKELFILPVKSQPNNCNIHP